MRRLMAAMFFSGLLVAAYALPAAATVTAIHVSGQETLDTWLDEGAEVWHGPPVEFLGMELPGTVAVQPGIVLRMNTVGSSPYVTGKNTYSFGHQLNYRTWRGGASGTTRLEPTAYPDGWFDCAYQAAYTGIFPPGAPNWTGHLVCKGHGSLDDVQLRLNLAFEAFVWTITFEGYVFVPGD